jgi:hypothetical protein
MMAFARQREYHGIRLDVAGSVYFMNNIELFCRLKSRHYDSVMSHELSKLEARFIPVKPTTAGRFILGSGNGKSIFP